MNKIYLDNNATTKLDPIIFETIHPFFSSIYGNPNSSHFFGEETHIHLSQAVDQLYKTINAHEEDTILATSGATESINTVHRSVLHHFLKNKGTRNQIITSPLEHAASQKSLAYLEELGIEVIVLPAVNETISIEDFKKYFNPDKTLLVSIIFAHHETGAILPIKEIAQITKEHSVLFHTDATQSVGKISIDVQELGVDFLSFSGHKFHGPKGIGGLFIKKNTPFIPLMHGGEQMGGLRSGTLNTAGIIGMGKALELAQAHLTFLHTQTYTLREKLEKFFRTIPDTIIYGEHSLRLPNTSFIKIKHIDPDFMVWHLNKNGIAVSTGSACSTKNLKTFSDKGTSDRGVRLSLSRFTTEEEIDTVINCIKTML